MAVKKNILAILITGIFFIVALYSFADNILYIISRRVTVSEITKIEKVPVAKPYKVYLTYYNCYTKSMEKTYIENIEEEYGDKLKISDKKNIYYRRYFPTEVYFVDHHAPNYGYLFLSFVFFILMFIGIVVLIKE